MKTFTAFLTLALAGSSLVAAQLGLPDCAQNCANSFLQGGIGNCGRDVECICRDKSFLGEIACCLAGDCNEADQKQAVAAAANICKAVGVNDLPTAVACSTGAGGATSTGKSSAAATTTGSSSGTGSGATTTPAPTGTAGGSGNNASSSSTNYGPRQTAAAAGLGAVGGIMAAVALL
ncbi:uncharacterized protein C8A04DRAFT_39967 [Dichotomopilus funicola]|uniref:CFEM domain-containing protein n=1 Tax=Dichotomopilus funicola TaxID=1934379 RepID=A0AAN6UWJ8_9PEZI|nr:hypothetical protein C8A04DRAFT_39967 [Dichotomopilus funicola]